MAKERGVLSQQQLLTIRLQMAPAPASAPSLGWASPNQGAYLVKERRMTRPVKMAYTHSHLRSDWSSAGARLHNDSHHSLPCNGHRDDGTPSSHNMLMMFAS
jgi:hypothetical protein